MKRNDALKEKLKAANAEVMSQCLQAFGNYMSKGPIGGGPDGGEKWLDLLNWVEKEMKGVQKS